MSSPLPIRRDASGRSAGALLRWAAVVSCACVVTLAASGCAKPRAEGLVAGPPLEVPQPPPRVLAPVELEAVSATAGAPPAAAPEVVSSPPAPANAGSQSGTRPAAPPAAPSAASQPPPAEAEAPRGEVRVVPSVEDTALEQQYQTAASNARRDLARVSMNLERLSANAFENFQQARRHLDLAEQNYRDRRLEIAVAQARAAAAVAALLLPAR